MRDMTQTTYIQKSGLRLVKVYDGYPVIKLWANTIDNKLCWWLRVYSGIGNTPESGFEPVESPPATREEAVNMLPYGEYFLTGITTA